MLLARRAGSGGACGSALWGRGIPTPSYGLIILVETASCSGRVIVAKLNVMLTRTLNPLSVGIVVSVQV